jgi:hypothetical protein
MIFLSTGKPLYRLVRRFSAADWRLRRLIKPHALMHSRPLFWVAVTNNFLEAFEWLLPYTA